MKYLGIDMIAAYSPEARGRSERMFGTLQGRLPKELKSAGITTMDDANRFLKQVFLPEFNKRFCVPAQEAQNAFVPWISGNISKNFGKVKYTLVLSYPSRTSLVQFSAFPSQYSPVFL